MRLGFAAFCLLIAFGIIRIRARPLGGARTAYYTYEPRISFLIGRILGRGRERD